MAAGTGYPLSVEEEIPLIGKAGFDGVFTGWYKGAPIRRWAALTAENGMFYQSIHAPFNRADKMWESGAEGDETAEELCLCLDDCKQNGIPVMVAHAFIGFDRHEPNERGIRRFSLVAEHAAALGVKLALENTEGEEYLAALMDALQNNPSVGFCIDTGHEMCYNSSRDMIGKYAHRVIATHLNDNMGITDPARITWHDDAHLLPFDGIADWEGIVRRLKAAGYTGPLTFELTCRNKPERHTHDAYAAWTIEEFLAHAYERAQKLQTLCMDFVPGDVIQPYYQPYWS